MPDSEANAAHFGRPKTHRTERCAYPQVRMVALAECGTHAITAAALGPLSSSEPALARGLFGHLGEGDLLLADRGFTGVELWRAAAAGGADLLWRIRSHQILPVREELPDGSYLSEIVIAKDRKRADPTTVRVIEYTLDGTGFPEQDAPYRLITTILDPEAAPAADLAALYHQRWEIETTLDEFKTHQRGPAQVLRSRSPDGVEQEVWGHLLVHYAIRSLMHDTADAAQLDADRLSFTRSSASPAARSPRRRPFPPDRLAAALTDGLARDSPAPAARPPQTLQPPRHQTQDVRLRRQTRRTPTPAPTRPKSGRGRRSSPRTGAPPRSTHRPRFHAAGTRSLKSLVLRLGELSPESDADGAAEDPAEATRAHCEAIQVWMVETRSTATALNKHKAPQQYRKGMGTFSDAQRASSPTSARPCCSRSCTSAWPAPASPSGCSRIVDVFPANCRRIRSRPRRVAADRFRVRVKEFPERRPAAF